MSHVDSQSSEFIDLFKCDLWLKLRGFSLDSYVQVVFHTIITLPMLRLLFSNDFAPKDV